MPIIEGRPNRVRIVRHISRLEKPNRDALVLYARFIGDAPDLRVESTDRNHAGEGPGLRRVVPGTSE
jgi:hypothetical protein